MNLQDAHPVLAEAGLNADSPRAADPRLRGLLLVLARAGWAVLAVLALVTFVISVPIYNAQLQTLCVAENPDTSCMAEQLAPQHLPALQASGFSLETYAGYLNAVRIFSELVCVVVALIIFWRKSDDRMALLVSIMLALSNRWAFSSIARRTASLPLSSRRPSPSPCSATACGTSTRSSTAPSCMAH